MKDDQPPGRDGSQQPAAQPQALRGLWRRAVEPVLVGVAVQGEDVHVAHDDVVVPAAIHLHRGGERGRGEGERERRMERWRHT